MSATIHVLPGVERRDLGEVRPDHDVLAGAIAEGVTAAVVVGRDRRGELYLASADGDADRVVGMLMRAVQYLAAMTIEQRVIETGGEGA
jgi:hypothetical protein